MAWQVLSRVGVRTLLVAALVVLASSCFQPVTDGESDGGAGGGSGGGAGGGNATGGGAGGGVAAGGGAGGGVAAGGGAGGGVATGGGAGGGGGEFDAGTPTMFGVMRADCAPNDGPAWHFVLSDTPAGCELLTQSEGYFIDLWVDPLVSGATYELTPGGNRQGSACLCGFLGDSSVSGTVRIDAVTPAGATGHIDAVFTSGTERHDTFNVIVCPGSRMCG